MGLVEWHEVKNKKKKKGKVDDYFQKAINEIYIQYVTLNLQVQYAQNKFNFHSIFEYKS